jgi:hypothetical protein
VKPTFPIDGKGSPLFSQPGDTGPKGPELWARLIEKAFAMHVGGYDDAEGIWDKDALSLLSSADVTEQSVTKQSEAEMGKAINAEIASGNFAVTANTSASRWDDWTRPEEGSECGLGALWPPSSHHPCTHRRWRPRAGRLDDVEGPGKTTVWVLRLDGDSRLLWGPRVQHCWLSWSCTTT